MDHRPPRRHFCSGRIRVCRGSRVLQVKSPSTSVDAEVTAATADPDEGTSASGPPAMDIEESWLVIDDAVDHLLHRAAVSTELCFSHPQYPWPQVRAGILYVENETVVEF
ncbi:uncharacterized protein LOC122375811 [Amphibalanus amphitrite]|uniref:uncharacterized protein LOC122366321 n=1 Tax=Amphibalanus amphitrite TaxID=1232801 RepID=UPI001C906964|nr:uncharacterized protein LOC122366321 [Amphibalanus amphitrite]XP_043211285.1 uncharacterized protein LOC122375811 [Amphibalanus amphitrite]